MFGFLCSDSQVLILLVSHTAFPCAGPCCGCTAVCVHSLSSPLHTQPSNSCTLPSSLWGQRLPSWQHSDSLVAPEMSTQLLRLGGKPCISIKWAFQAKHIHALAAIESGPAVLSVSQGGFYLVYLLNAVKKKTKMKGHISGSVRCETITPDFQRSTWCFHSPANFLIGQFVTRVKLPSTSKIHFG